MFKKLVIASVVLAASSGIAFAYHPVKGGYKGEVVPSVPACPTYGWLCGPYVGASVGVRNNYTSLPTVYKGLEGVLYLGYGGAITPTFYLAGELFGGDSIQLKDYKNGGNGVKTTWNYGLDLLPGIMLTDNLMGYLRVGVVRARFSDQSTDKTGWQVGAGGQSEIGCGWYLRAEYVYSQYQNVSGIGKPSTDQFNVGVIYGFL